MTSPETSPEFLDLLMETLIKAMPADGAPRDADRAMARAMYEAFQPTDALEAARAAQAVAAFLASMDGFARAARAGMSNESVVRLRGSAIAACRVFLAALQGLQKQEPQARGEASSRSAAQRSLAALAPASQVRHRAELPSVVPGLADALLGGSRRAGWRGATALTPIAPTVTPPD